MTDLLTPGQLDKIADHVRRGDQTAQRPQSPPPPDPDTWQGRQFAAQEAKRLERRRAMEEANARRQAEAQADADEARAELVGFARQIRRRDADRSGVEREARELIAKGRRLLSEDRARHGDFDDRVTRLQARAAAVPPRKEHSNG